MNNNTDFFIINNKRKAPFNYENKDFFFEIISSHIINKNFPNNTYNQEKFHLHSYYELHVILDGCSCYEIENRESLEVRKGNFVIFSPKTKHKITKETPFFSKFILNFDFSSKNSTKSQFYNKLEKKLKNPEVYAIPRHIHSIFQSIYQISRKKYLNYETTCSFLEFSILLEMFNVIVEEEITNSIIKYEDVRINKSIEYIKSNLRATLKVSDVAEYLNLSIRQFTKIFSEQTGISPGKYINNRIILYSTDLLVNSDLSINDIVDILSFPDASTFIKSFKKSKGITPSKYRKLNKKL